MTVNADQMITELSSQYGSIVTRKQLIEYTQTANVSLATICKRLEPYKTGRGVYTLTVTEARQQFEEQMKTDTPVREKQNLVPDKDVNYVPFGNFTDVKKIIKSHGTCWVPVFFERLT